MTSTVSVPLFGHQAGVNGLTGQRVSVLVFFAAAGRVLTVVPLFSKKQERYPVLALFALFMRLGRYSDHGALLEPEQGFF